MKANEAANKGKQVKEYSQPNTDTTKNNTKDVTASTTQNPQQRTNSSLSNYNSSNIGAAIPNNPEKSPTNSQNSANLSNNSVSQDSPKPNQTVALTIKNLTIPTSPAPTSSVSNSPAPTSSVSNSSVSNSSVSNSSVSNSSVSNSSVPNSNSNVPNSSGNLSLTPNNQLGSLVSDKTSNDIANKGVKVNNYQPISTMKNQQQVKSGISATKTTATFSTSLKAPNFNSTISKPPTIHSSYVLTPKPGNKTTQVQNESTTAPKTTTTTTSSITPSQSSGKIVKRPLNQILNESEKRLLPTNSQPKPVSDFPPVKVTIPTTTNSNQSTNSNSCLSENNQNSTSATSMCVPLDGSQMRVQFLHESDPEKNKEVPLNLKSTTVAFIKDGESFQRIGYLNDFFFKFMLKVEFRQPNRPIFIISCEKGKNTNDFETIDEGKTTWSNPDIYVCFRLFKNGIKILKEDDQSYPMILEKTPFAFFNIPFALTSHQLVELLY
ncbi:hypothetical protein TRFO_42966 [Tritrichomonas foetus]|uniref:Uncharacterized protein n=1 Tax=Tritrichomonas foetus TaxID=1144522 RepID=A0A1J4KYC9_9EUKA|nr:hypothetical protein TRFO_42966 [Tritrichomonas foetus]|eukprot:OHT14565.1 hypothetical protein TRFO_42966 [Tritrichomonas foetus]